MIDKIQNILVLSLISFGYSISAQNIPLTVQGLEAINVKAEEVQYKGKKGVRITGKAMGEQLAVLKGTDFGNGTIELELSGKPLASADSTARGFVGVAFRVQTKDTVAYECFYIRPTNGRSSDQLRRNHSVQYVSHPDFPWFKLRKENPGLYESYADLIPGEWTKIKVVVKDHQAKLYVNGADQPCLIVNDLKRGISGGPVALWIDNGTDAYFADIKIKK
jgi:Domain of Unknown Function (DUF1080)